MIYPITYQPTSYFLRLYMFPNTLSSNPCNTCSIVEEEVMFHITERQTQSCLFTHPMPLTSEFWKRGSMIRVFEMNNSKAFPAFIILLFYNARFKSVEHYSCPSNIIYSKISPKHFLNRTKTHTFFSITKCKVPKTSNVRRYLFRINRKFWPPQKLLYLIACDICRNLIVAAQSRNL
jgi:hypothetical protein